MYCLVYFPTQHLLHLQPGGSKATNNILASWSKMFGGQVVLVILNAWCMKMFLSGYGNMMASSYGFTKFFAATLCLVGFCKITFKLVPIWHRLE